jgi:hypothetical protein
MVPSVKRSIDPISIRVGAILKAVWVVVKVRVKGLMLRL